MPFACMCACVRACVRACVSASRASRAFPACGRAGVHAWNRGLHAPARTDSTRSRTDHALRGHSLLHTWLQMVQCSHPRAHSRPCASAYRKLAVSAAVFLAHSATRHIRACGVQRHSEAACMHAWAPSSGRAVVHGHSVVLGCLPSAFFCFHPFHDEFPKDLPGHIASRGFLREHRGSPVPRCVEVDILQHLSADAPASDHVSELG